MIDVENQIDEVMELIQCYGDSRRDFATISADKELQIIKDKLRTLLSSVQSVERDSDTKRHLAIGKAIERAAIDMPEGTELLIELEKGAGTVTIIDRDGNEHQNFDHEGGFAGVVNGAIDAAIAASQPNGEAA